MRRLAPVLLGLLGFLGAGTVRPVAADEPAADAPVFWNGRDKAREVWALAKEYFDATAERQAAIRTELDALGEIRFKDVGKYAKKILKYAASAGPKLTKKASQPFTHGGLTGLVHVQGAKRKKPLLVALHGGGKGVGDGKNAMQKWGLASGKCIVIAPTAPELRDSAWNQPDIEAWVLALIEAAKRTWSCDTNRIYLAGHSMGGYGTWSIGCRHADRFAALAPCAGGLFAMRTGNGELQVQQGLIPNLLNTPIRFFNSTDDKQVSPKTAQAADKLLGELKAEGYPFEWIYDEYTDIGHGLPPKGLSPIVKWMQEKERDPHPKHVLWEPGRNARKRFAWIGSTGGGRIEGRVEGNVVTLTGSGATASVTVYLAPDLVDLRKPVTIRRGDETLHEGRVPLRLSILLQTIAETRDPAQCYCAAIDAR